MNNSQTDSTLVNQNKVRNQSVDRDRSRINTSTGMTQKQPQSHQHSYRNSEENLVNINDLSNQNISLYEEEDEFMKVRTDDTFMNKM